MYSVSMKPKVYLETTIPSYIAGSPSRDLVIAAHQQITREWWDGRGRFSLFISQVVLQEVSSGDDEAAARRLSFVADIPILQLTEEVRRVAHELLSQKALPAQAAVDALHVAVAVVNGMDYLLTWNCTHIANAAVRSKIERVCRSLGYEPPVICTPEELLEE
jgi:predicted nucleic acid-binding protein